MKTFWLGIVILAFSAFSLTAQETDVDLEGEIVIQLQETVDQTSFLSSFKQKNPFADLVYLKTISPVLNMHLLYYPTHLRNSTDLVTALAAYDEVKAVGPNFRAKLRSIPNDPNYDEQWGLETINAPEVWDFTTGGLTALGDTIVIATLEGADINHEDLKDNIWRNWAEIPNDGIDNDDNGYIDDHFGVNISNDGDLHTPTPHGTSVAGLLAAKGDNNIGVTGVTWNTKLMVVTNTLAFDEIIESYMYVHEMRRRYNDSDGAEGAFVVVTNASFGVDGKFPDENALFPAWCEAFELLGEEGVLSAGATSNDEINIDQVGDIPSTCSSNFLISVTNTDKQDELDSAFSQDSIFDSNNNFLNLVSTHIDLSAPGRGSFTTKNNDGYGSFGGTSASTPHLAGSIALLYSAPCNVFAQQAKDDPETAAILMKEFIMDGVWELDELKNKTVSGGRLDLKASLELIQSFCGGTTGPLEITSVSPNPVVPGQTLRVRYKTPDPTPYTISVYNVLGQLLDRIVVEASTFSSGRISIKTINFAAGMYFLTIENINDYQTTKFLVGQQE